MAASSGGRRPKKVASKNSSPVRKEACRTYISSSEGSSRGPASPWALYLFFPLGITNVHDAGDMNPSNPGHKTDFESLFAGLPCGDLLPRPFVFSTASIKRSNVASKHLSCFAVLWLQQGYSRTLENPQTTPNKCSATKGRKMFLKLISCVDKSFLLPLSILQDFLEGPKIP